MSDGNIVSETVGHEQTADEEESDTQIDRHTHLEACSTLELTMK